MSSTKPERVADTEIRHLYNSLAGAVDMDSQTLHLAASGGVFKISVAENADAEQIGQAIALASAKAAQLLRAEQPLGARPGSFVIGNFVPGQAGQPEPRWVGPFPPRHFHSALASAKNEGFGNLLWKPQGGGPGDCVFIQAIMPPMASLPGDGQSWRRDWARYEAAIEREDERMAIRVAAGDRQLRSEPASRI